MISDFNLLDLAVPFEVYCGIWHRCEWCGEAIIEGLRLPKPHTAASSYHFCNKDCLKAWDAAQAKEYGEQEDDDG